jgi:hypothetical protein
MSAILLFSLANVLIEEDLYPTPSKLPVPTEGTAITHERIIVARNGASFRFVLAAQYDVKEADWRRKSLWDKPKKEPRWAVFVEQFNEQEDYICGASSFVLGLIRQEARWTYALSTRRIDNGFYMERSENGIDWKGDEENPYVLPPEQIQKLRPLVVAELNRRHPGTKLGDRLETMLDDGLEVSSLSYPPQNAAVLMKWLAILMAVLGFGLMFVRPRPVSIPCSVLPMSQNEMLLTKIAPARARLYKRYKDAC